MPRLLTVRPHVFPAKADHRSRPRTRHSLLHGDFGGQALSRPLSMRATPTVWLRQIVEDPACSREPGPRASRGSVAQPVTMVLGDPFAEPPSPAGPRQPSRRPSGHAARRLLGPHGRRPGRHPRQDRRRFQRYRDRQRAHGPPARARRRGRRPRGQDPLSRQASASPAVPGARWSSRSTASSTTSCGRPRR